MYRTIDISKYPFLVKLSDILSIKYPGLRIEDVLKNPDSYPFNRSLKLLEYIVSKNTLTKSTGSPEDEVLAFYSLILGAVVLGDRGLLHRIAFIYSKYTSRSLSRESLDNVLLIAKKLGLDVDKNPSPPKVLISVKNRGLVTYITKPISIDLKQYLIIVSKKLAHDSKYMLINQIVDNGRVFIDKETLIRLIEESIYNKIINYASELEFDSKIIDTYIFKYKEILEKHNWFKKREVSGELFFDKKFDPNKLPPCIKNILTKIESSENPSHHERFALASFLINIGLDIDIVLEFFKKTPDYNEKIARYQVEHISGLRGSRRKYLPYNCDNMKSLGICPINSYCEGGKNPLSIYRYNLRGKKEERNK